MQPINSAQKQLLFAPDSWVVELDGGKMRTLRTFYQTIARQLHFPDYFDPNLDALFDSLCSLDHAPDSARKVAVVIRHPRLMLSRARTEERQSVLDVLKDACIPENRYDELSLSVYSFDE